MTADVLPFRRRVVLHRTAAGVVEASVEDHIHHFEVRVEHGDEVTGIDGRAVRAPWSLCPGAIAGLQELVGSPVGTFPRVDDRAVHCTHLLDLAMAAVHAAADPTLDRTIELTVTGWDTPRSSAEARRSDGTTLQWTVEGRQIVGPEAFRGRSLAAGFSALLAELDRDTAELAFLLRPATWMGAARGIHLDDFDVLSDSFLAPGSCFASQPDRIHIATRNRGSSIPALD